MARKFDIRPRCDMRNRRDTKDMMREMQRRCDIRDVIPEMQHVKCKMRDANQMRLPSKVRDDHSTVTDGAGPRYFRIRPIQ